MSGSTQVVALRSTRVTLRPHLARAVLAAPVGFIAPPAVIVIAPSVIRVTPRPHLARAVPATPVAFIAPPATIIRQRAIRPLSLRAHVAPPIITPAAVFVAPRPIVVGQARSRVYVGRTCPRPHVALPIVTPAAVFVAPRPVIVGQARSRALVGRTCPRPHVAPANLAPKPFRPAIVVSQSQARIGVYRRHQKPLTATGIVSPIIVEPTQWRLYCNIPRPTFHSRLHRTFWTGAPAGTFEAHLDHDTVTAQLPRPTFRLRSIQR